MIGIIILALYIYQKFNVNSFGIKKSHSLRVEDTLSLSARKTLYVIRSGKERFLIAGDMERTTLISRLEEGEELAETVVSADERPKYINPVRRHRGANLSDEEILSQDNVAPLKKPIMKEIKKKLRF
jgi:flagellar biogenesis protein FliO